MEERGGEDVGATEGRSPGEREVEMACSPLGRTEDLLVYSEEAGEHGAVLLVQLPGTAAADVLLDVGRVASEKAGNRGVITPSLLDQIVQGFACIFHRCG